MVTASLVVYMATVPLLKYHNLGEVVNPGRHYGGFIKKITDSMTFCCASSCSNISKSSFEVVSLNSIGNHHLLEVNV